MKKNVGFSDVAAPENSPPARARRSRRSAVDGMAMSTRRSQLRSVDSNFIQKLCVWGFAVVVTVALCGSMIGQRFSASETESSSTASLPVSDGSRVAVSQTFDHNSVVRRRELTLLHPISPNLRLPNTDKLYAKGIITNPETPMDPRTIRRIVGITVGIFCAACCVCACLGIRSFKYNKRVRAREHLSKDLVDISRQLGVDPIRLIAVPHPEGYIVALKQH